MQVLTTLADLLAIGDEGLPVFMEELQQTVLQNYAGALSAESSLDVRPPGLHASEVSKCGRLATYSLRGEPKNLGEDTTPVRMKKIFDLGHLVHRQVQKNFHRAAAHSKGVFTFKDEVPITPYINGVAKKWNIQSTNDGIFEFWERPIGRPAFVFLRVGIEIKSINPEDFKTIKKDRTPPETAHIEQSHIYMACLDLPLTWIIYVDKSSGEFSPPEPPYLIPFDPKIWAELEARFADWHHHLAHHTLPDGVEGFHCTWCPYRGTCRPAYLTKQGQGPAIAEKTVTSARKRGSPGTLLSVRKKA